jgi:glutathione synthase
MQTPSFLWVTDPWPVLYNSKDTTLRLMQEAFNMGIPTFWAASDFIFSSPNSGEIMAVELTRKTDCDDLSLLTPRPIALSTFQQVHYRIDPPVNDEYRRILNRLITEGVKPTRILNPPDIIQFQTEKLPPPELLKYAPRHFLIQQKSDADPSRLMDLFKNDTEIVSKPMNLFQSMGVQKNPVPKSIGEWDTLLMQLTQNYTQPVLLEEYLPQIHSGETRLWFVGDHLIGAIKKFPKQGDFRVLIDEGSRVAPHELDEIEAIIARDVGKSLKNQGIYMAAVDLIDHRICDYNFTSPGLLVQLEEVNGGKNLARTVLNLVLEYREPEVRE